MEEKVKIDFKKLTMKVLKAITERIKE